MKKLQVGLGDRSYPIYFGTGIIHQLGELCRVAGMGNRVGVITNPTVGTLYFETVRNELHLAGFVVTKIEIPDGEEFKTMESLNSIYNALIQNEFDRGSWIVALGGGVIGDIAGFAAATFLRGIPFVQVPTTLLAQVDSSVGGKTGVNHVMGKNLIGSFYQPKLVAIDVHMLCSLAEREFRSGLAEVVKYGIILDSEFFRFLQNETDALKARDHLALEYVVHKCCALKAGIVEQDEREGGLRAVLNYGHTFAHAVETLTGYTSFSHGEAVAIGMVQAASCSEHFGFADKADVSSIIYLLTQFELPIDLPPFHRSAYRDVLLRDKKVRDGGLNFVFNKGIGNYIIRTITDIDSLLFLNDERS